MGDHIFLHPVPGLDGKHTLQAGGKIPLGPGVGAVQPIQASQSPIARDLLLELPGKPDLLPFPTVDGKPYSR